MPPCRTRQEGPTSLEVPVPASACAAHAVRCAAASREDLLKGLHGVGDVVVVRAADFSASTERLALCALLETYDITYVYVDGIGAETSSSPYALSAAGEAALRTSTAQTR